MKITADTNVLVRAVTEDHVEQSRAAQVALRKADVIAISIPALCELVWVLSQGYKVRAPDIAATIRALINGANVVVNRPVAEAGIAMLDAGGDFADGAGRLVAERDGPDGDFAGDDAAEIGRQRRVVIA